VAKVVERNIVKLEEFERNNPGSPLKAIRDLSVMIGGGELSSCPNSPLNLPTSIFLVRFLSLWKENQADEPQVVIAASS
jgi:hypothetical protein